MFPEPGIDDREYADIRHVGGRTKDDEVQSSQRAADPTFAKNAKVGHPPNSCTMNARILLGRLLS